MTRKIMTLIIGNIIASLGIAMVVHSGLGCFAITAANMSLANIFGITIGLSGMIVELIMLAIAIYYGEGLGWTTICNCIVGSWTVDLFIRILPTHPLMVIGLIPIVLGWAMMGSVGLGDTSSNILMNALCKRFHKPISLIRGIEECAILIIGLIGARNYVTLFTIILSIGFGYFMQVIYKVIKYNPIDIKHKFIIGRK